jgi:hypothetical protein
MGGKRPEQSHKDLMSTDHKTRTDDPKINEEDKHLLHTQRGHLALPKNGENPALTDLKKKREEADGEQADEEA